MPITVVSVSGGKDSTATYLKALERGKPFQAVFADTGNEAQETYDYIRALPGSVGGPEIEWVKADLSERIINRARMLPEKWAKKGISDAKIAEALEYLKPTGNPFLDACLMRGSFPSTRRRFCTEVLKIEPVTDHVYRPIVESGRRVIAWNGVRRDESQRRSQATMFERSAQGGIEIMMYRPLLHWTESDVFAYIRTHGLEPNPLYASGAGRVGCFPCIFARKMELRLIADKFPDAIDRIEGWERLIASVAPHESGTFFKASDIPGVEKQACAEQGLTEPKYITVERKDEDTGELVPVKIANPKWQSPKYDFRKHGIRLKVEWSKTDRGGRQYDLLHDAQADHNFNASEECSMGGYCE